MTSDKELILVCDDNEDARYALERIVAHNGFSVASAENGREAVERARALKPALIFLDLMMPGMDGFEAARQLKADPTLRFTPIILVTARDSLEDVVKGFDAGADDYITKPFKAEELMARLRAALRLRSTYAELRSTKEENEVLIRELTHDFDAGKIVGTSAAIQRVLSILERAAKSDAPILVTGESGTGKELAAHAIHHNSPRKNRPFIARNCAAFSEHLLESELFGHVKGAFTSAIRDQKGLFEAADGGTLFLDEVGEMPLALQPKLLRVLQEGTFTPVGSTNEKHVNVRVVAATNRDLQKMVAERTFREDLYYRLNVVSVRLPALRERREDIPELIKIFLARGSAKYGVTEKQLSPEARRCLTNYDWPGNIRELQNEIERLLILSSPDSILDIDLLSERILERTREGDEGEVPAPSTSSYKEAVEGLERRLILEALERSAWNKSDAARSLGISRSNLLAKIQAFQLSPKAP